MAGVGVTPIGARLAYRGVRPRRVSAKRSWPPGCGRFPAAPSATGGDGEKGVIEDRVEEVAASQPETEGTVDVRKEGGDARPSGAGDALALAERESGAIEVKPPASAAPKSSAVVAASGSAEPLSTEGNINGGLGSGQLGREEVVAVDRNGRAADDVLETVRTKKRWLMSALNPPPRRRAISAVRKFPPGLPSCCHRQQS